MDQLIHPSAIISPGAVLGRNVRVGAFAIIEHETQIGDDCIIEDAACVKAYTKIGAGSRIFRGAVLGHLPQDYKYKEDRSFVIIGKGNMIREFVTIHRGTERDSATVLGDNNMLMAYSHIGHNSRVGSNVIIANGSQISGHVEIEDRAFLSGLVAVHQFTRIGKFAMVGGCTKIVQDVPPFMTVDGNPAAIYGLNSVGLKRAGFSSEARMELKKALKELLVKSRPLKEVLSAVSERFRGSEDVRYLVDFIRSSKRGIVSCAINIASDSDEQ
ncbi:MAG: acyl-[acyl-carrier-protein]--UDP-N-acetylglucosamine O-acyltransferase [Lentisphaerae bacterium GWF2_52_8]|nr:MAG: acyl-[acyl-carrier-protein]--UDP-N-acetylglucosamine O-acyltransferase [Lentisphaerae bacterium GWF2_52_8]